MIAMPGTDKPRHAMRVTIAVTALAMLAVTTLPWRAQSRSDTEREAACEYVRGLERSQAGRRALAARRPGPVVAFLGDSYTQGLFLPDPLDAFPYLLADRLDIAPVVDGRGGSGFVSDGACPGTVFADRLERVMAAHPDV